MVAALWSNPNWDDTQESQGNRSRAVDGINEDFKEAVEAVETAFTSRAVPEEDKLDKNNPFFAAAERGLEKVDKRVKKLQSKIDQQRNSDSKPADYMKDIDQG